jgi:hypothetical protein
MAGRSVPSLAQAKRAKHEEQLSEMHDALYQLGDHARTPMNDGSKLLPGELAPENPKAATAKKHIAALHGMFKSLRKGKESK